MKRFLPFMLLCCLLSNVARAAEMSSTASGSFEFSIVSVTAADGTNLTGNISGGKLDLAVLQDRMKMVINCSNAQGYYLSIDFGSGNQFLTQTADRLVADADGNFTWIGGYDYELYDIYEYPIICTLYDAEHQGNAVCDPVTVLTLVGTTKWPVSDVKLVSADPDFKSTEDIEVPAGDDLVVTLTFSDYVSITASISQGLVGSVPLTATGVDGTGDGEGNYTQWTITIPASELDDEDYGGGITLSISGTAADGMLLFDTSGYMTITYYYTLTGDDVDINLIFDPANGSTVESLSTIIATAGDGYTLKYVSYESSFPIYKDGKRTGYELYNNEDLETGNPGARDGEESTDDVDGLVFSIADTSDIIDDETNTYNWNAEITEEGTYTVTFPKETFKVRSTTYEEEVVLTYTIGTANEDNTGDDTSDGIGSIKAAISDGAELYNLAGQKINTPVKGVNVVKYTDGSIKKVLQK